MKPISNTNKLFHAMNTERYKQLKPGEFMSTDEIQTDPTGRNAQETGAKLDAGKNRVGLVLGDFASALEEVCKVGTAGAEKYSPHSWISVPNGIERYTDAMQRHYLKECKGEILDPELTAIAQEPIHHAACLAWNALARLKLILDEENNVEKEVWKQVDKP